MTKASGLSGLPLLQAIVDMQADLHQQIHAAAYKVNRGRDPVDDATRAEPLLWGWIKERIFAGELAAYGVKAGEDDESLIKDKFLRAATPNFDASSLTAEPLIYRAVSIVRTADIPPAAAQAAPGASPSVIRSPRSVGGRPPKFDWPAFVQELVRVANSLDGIESRRELTAHMKTWCSTNWEEPPEDDTIRRQVLKFCPPNIPADPAE